MRRLSQILLALLAVITLGLLGFPASASHDTEPHRRLEHIANRFNRVNSDRPSQPTVNSDLAFWGTLAAQGTYDGFRLFDIRNPSAPRLLVDFECPGSQGDVSLHKAGNRLLLFRSIDAPQDRARCENSAGAGVGAQTGDYWEGIRIIDVTNPTNPKFIKGVYNDCGSHTHTTIRDPKNNRAIIYVSSYPLGAPTMDPDGTGRHEGCVQPHQKIAVVVVPDANPARARVHHYQEVDAPPASGLPGPDAPLDGVIGCHDITAFTHSKIQTAAAACITEGQLWDISDPLYPCTQPVATPEVPRNQGEDCHTHIRNGSVEIWHSSAFTWDGRIVLFGDEHTGAVTGPGCFGPEDPTGNMWFYKYVRPGTPAAPLLGRYHIPRPQPSPEVCSIHNFNVIPVDESKAYIAVSAAYSGGTTVVNFSALKTADPTNLQGSAIPIVPREVAFWDTEKNSDKKGNNDVWSAYWYNNFIYSSDITRGLDVFEFLRRSGSQFTAVQFGFHNPQTQERLLRPRPDRDGGGGGGGGDNGGDDDDDDGGDNGDGDNGGDDPEDPNLIQR